MKENYSFEAVDYDPFSSFELEKVVTPIEPQKEIWISCLLGGDDANRSYNESISLKFKGILNYNALLFAIGEVVARHEALRCTFSPDGKSICINKGLTPELLNTDLSGETDTTQEKLVSSYLKDNATRPFDLVNGPLIRVALFKLSDQDHLFVFTAHHIVCDGWSFGIIVEELAQIYSALLQRAQPNLPDAYPFSQYVREVQRLSDSDAYRKIEQYWLDQYKTPPPPLELPLDRRRPDTRMYKSQRYDCQIDSALGKAIKQLGIKAQASLVSTLIAAFEVYLYRSTGQEDIVLGLPTAGQAAMGEFNLVGHCVNVLPLRSRPSGSLSFIDYLRERSLKLADDFDHQQLTFGSLLQKVSIERDASRIPLIPFVLNIDMGMDTPAHFHNLTYELFTNPREYETFEIFLNIGGSGGALNFEWSYNSHLFEEQTIRKIMGDVKELLLQAVTHPETRIRDFVLPSNDTLDKLIVWNATKKSFSTEKPFTKYLDEIASKYPRKLAIEFFDQEVSYEDLVKKSNQIAHYLVNNGIQPNDIIGVCMPRSPEMVMTLLGIIKSGAAYLPLDPDYPKDRINYMLKDSTARLLVADDDIVKKFDTSTAKLAIESFWDELNTYPVASPEVEIDGQACAYVLYTSGSTGNPKGVQIEHHSLTNFLLSMQIAPGMTTDDRILAITTISFDIAGLELFLPLITGATLVLADAESARDGRILLEWLSEKQISFLQATPATWRMLLKAGWNKPLPLKALCGGEAMPLDVADSLLAYCQSVWNMYGPTETTVWSTIKKLAPGEPMLTVGRPIHNTKIYLLDGEMALTAPGSIGEIYIGGDGVARGYLNRAELTNERFFKDPFSDEEGARMYRTGDLGRFLNNGEIVCLGRVDQQVKIRGYRIELGEIEQAIGNIEGVDETVVIAREDVPGEKKLVAYVTVDKGDVVGLPFSPNRDQIVYWKKELQKSLPDYMIPGEWVVMGTFPLTENKKIDRKAFPAPAPGDMETMPLQQPVSTIQKMVAEIWCRSLGLTSVGLDNDFFELGGHSLTAVEIITELEKSTGKRLPLTTLFKHSRLGEFAALFEEEDQRLSDPQGNLANLLAEEIKQSLNINLREHRSKHNAVSETTLEGNGDDPYFFQEEETIGSRDQIEKEVPTTEPQREIWLSCVMGGEQGNLAYVVSHSLTLHGELDYPAMEWALSKLISRHESLRSYLTSDGLNMVIYSGVSIPIHYRDFSYLEKLEQNENLENYLEAEGNFSFDLNKGSLIRISLLKLASHTHILTLTAHHVIMDGWSVGVIIEELAHLYSSRILAIAEELPIAKPFSDYAEEQRLFLTSPQYQENLNYWINQYKGPVPLLDIPTTYPRPKVRNFASKQAKQVVEESLNRSLRGMAVKLNCTFVNMLMTAFEAFLNRLTGQTEIVLGLPAAGQAATGYSNLVGHCVNFLPIRSRVDEKLTFQQYLSLRKPEIYASYEHQQLTFGTLLKEIKLPRDASRVPLVPIAFNVDFGINHGVKFHGLDFELVSNPKGFQNFEITLNVQVLPEYLVIEWNYNQELFDEATIEGYIQEFNSWLNFIVENSNDTIGSFTLSGDKNTSLILSKRSFVPNFSSFKPVHQLIDEAASRLPDKTAVLCNDRKYTYAELIQTANQLSHYLIDKGVRKGDVVGIVMNRSIDTIVAIIGCLKAGAAYLPIDTDFPTGRVEYMLQDAARMHLVDREYSGIFKSPSTEVIFEDFYLGKDEFSKSTPQIHILRSDAAYVIYTSGSTGKPKGVVLEHGNLFNFILIVDQDPGLSYQDIFLSVSSVSFDVSILEVLLPYVNGAQSFMLDKHQRKDPQQIMRQITDHRITHMFATPSHWKMLLESKQWNTKIPYFNIISGGEALSKSLADSLLPLCKSLWNIYGPTETTVYSTIKQITDQQEIITIGKPVYNTTIYILDESLQQVPQGEIGELFIAGEGVGRGYLNRPELTAERFIKDPFHETSERKMYRTGDLGKYTSDGEIIVIGRKDFQVKIRGHRIELGEIEDAISNLEGIRDVAVITKIDQNENLYLAAYLLLSRAEIHKDGLAVASSPESIKEWNGMLQNFLSAYMLPSEYFILEQFPLTTSGKIDRQALAQVETIPYDGVYSTTTPETPEEKLITEIWENALNIQNTDITRDFFELGGHSMIAVQVMTQLEKRTNIKLPISVLFEYPTIRGLAKYIKEKGGKNPWNSLVFIKPSGSKIPLYIVHGGGMNVMPFYAIAKHLDREQPLYGLQAYGLNGKDEPLTTIEAIAAQYLSEILRENPDGPYALAGYSLGGLVAFEMAQQLKRQGKEITALVMFDTYAIRSDHSNSLTMKAANFVRREVGKRLFDLELLISNPRLLKRLKKDSLRGKTDRIKNKLNLKENETEIIQIINKLKKVHIHAGDEYKILPYEGEIYLFRAKIRTSYERDHKYFGWRSYVNKVNVIEMEGEHTTMFEPPNEINFVKILQRILNDVDLEKA